MADLETLKRKQAEAARDAMAITKETDPKVILEIAAKVAEKTAELQKMALALAAAVTLPDSGGKETVVKLTPDQKQRVTEGTGAGIEVVTLRDSRKKVWSRELPLGRVEPREIEAEATREGARLRLIAETRTHVEKIIKELKKLNVPEIAENIAELERDPTLGLAKK